MATVTTSQQRILDTLRSPSRLKAQVLKSFATEGETCLGTVLRFEKGEHAVMPADGKIMAARKVFADWPGIDESFRGQLLYEAIIDHGAGVTTVLSGLSDISALRGVLLPRGTVVGSLFYNDLLFRVLVENNPVYPGVNFWLISQDENIVPGQGNCLRAAPDVTGLYTGGTFSRFVAGIRYYYDTWTAGAFAINVDFNGNGTKQGLAAAGIAAADYWNVFASGAFSYATDANACYTYSYASPTLGKVPNVNPVSFLRAHNGRKTGVRLVRGATATADAGNATYFDTMLSTWIGSSTATNVFTLEGLPAGAYVLYVYCAGPVGSSAVSYVAGVNLGSTSVSNIAGSSFAEGTNYAKFSFTLTSRTSVAFTCAGYLNGLQILRS